MTCGSNCFKEHIYICIQDNIQNESWCSNGISEFLWGATNPLIKKGSYGVNKIKCDNFIMQFLSEIHFLARNWRYVLPFILNQSGSVVYYFTLQQADLSLAVPVVNSLTFVFTALSGWALGEEIPSKGTLMGMLLVLSGITLCVFDKVTNFNSVK